MCGQIPERFGEVRAAFPGTECCGVRTAARSMIGRNKDGNKTERCLDSLQSLQAYLRAKKYGGAWLLPLPRQLLSLCCRALRLGRRHIQGLSHRSMYQYSTKACLTEPPLGQVTLARRRGERATLNYSKSICTNVC